MGVSVDAIEMVAEDEVVETVETEPGEAGPAAGARRRRVVTVENKDNAETIRLRVPVTTSIETVIEKIYAEFRLERAADDRLTCRRSGQDVFQHGDRTVAQYLDEGLCPNLRWVFVGGTGGA